MRRHQKGFSMLELIVVMAVIIISIGLSFWALQGRSAHFRMRGTIREFLQLMRLTQASAIKTNARMRIRFQDNSTYEFQYFDTGANDWLQANVPFVSGRLALPDQKLPQGITFSSMNLIAGCNAGTWPCQSPRFNPDGTMNPAGTFRITDGKESFGLQWTVGGSIRVQ